MKKNKTFRTLFLVSSSMVMFMSADIAGAQDDVYSSEEEKTRALNARSLEEIRKNEETMPQQQQTMQTPQMPPEQMAEENMQARPMSPADTENDEYDNDIVFEDPQAMEDAVAKEKELTEVTPETVSEPLSYDNEYGDEILRPVPMMDDAAIAIDSAPIKDLQTRIREAKKQAVSLRDVVAYGVYTNPEYGVVANNRRATDEELRQAQGLYLPSVDLRADGGYEYTDDPGSRGGLSEDQEDELRYDASLTLTQMLFDGFETKYENKRQKARVLSASNRAGEVAELVGLDIVESYLDIIRQRKLLEIARSNVEEHTRILGQINESAEAGRTTTANVEQVNARLAAAKTNESETREALRVAEARYIQETGVMPGELILPTVPYDELTASVEDEVRIALEQSPTLKVLEADIDVANAEYKGSKSTYYPQLDLQLNGRSGEDLGGIEGRDTSASALVIMNWNLYRGGIDTARVRELINREAQEKEERAETARSIENEVRTTWASMVSAGERTRNFAVQSESNAKVVEAYQDQFDLNRRTLLDVLDAQNELFVSQSSKVNAEFVEMFAIYRLIALKGELLSMMNINHPSATKLENERSYWGDISEVDFKYANPKR